MSGRALNGERTISAMIKSPLFDIIMSRLVGRQM